MSCFGTANWKREVVPDHKFDFVDTRDYHSNAFGTRMQYMWLYVILVKSFLVYLSDLYSAITMLTTKTWSNNIFARCQQAKLNNCVVVDFSVGKWIFVGCIIFGYMLLVYEGWKAKKIILSRDISYTFTNVMAQNYYSLRSYDHFCFFQQIENSTKKKDDFAFFVFFTFKGWKRLILSDGPRQSINCLTLYSFWLVNSGSLNKIEDYWNAQPLVTKTLLLSILFTVIVFLGSLLVLIVAAFCYIPLLCYIQGNLKEYCCHKVDKRITELMKRKNKQRVNAQARLAQKEARGDFSHLKNKKGDLMRNPIPQPTLPQLDIDEFSPAPRAPKSNYASSYAASAQTRDTDPYGVPPLPVPGAGGYVDYPPDLHGAAPEYPPAMPLYDQYAYGAPAVNHYDAGAAYPPHDRHATPAPEFANSSTHLAHGGPDDYGLDNYYGDVGDHKRAPSNGAAQYLAHDAHNGVLPAGAEGHDDKRASLYSVGLAYDTVEAPTTPHRRTASGAYRREEDFTLQQQQRGGPPSNAEYQQQWVGYGRDSYGREQGQSPSRSGHGHARQKSKDDYGHSHAM